MWPLFFVLVVTTEIRLCFPIKIINENPIPTEEGFRGSDAELAHFTGKHFNFVDYRRKLEDPIMERYDEAESGHSMTARSYTPEIWEELEEKIPDVAEQTCRRYLNEPVFAENEIEFDDEDIDSISLVRKNLVFLHYEKLSQSLIFVQCPVIIQGVKGSNVYTTPLEEIEKQKVDYYFVLVDLFYEDIEDGTDEVVVLLGSQLGAKVPIIERFQKIISKVFTFWQ